jgi:hypothetical protein
MATEPQINPINDQKFAELLASNPRVSELLECMSNAGVKLDYRLPSAITLVDKGNGKTFLIVDFTRSAIQTSVASDGSLTVKLDDFRSQPFTSDSEVLVIANSQTTSKGYSLEIFCLDEGDPKVLACWWYRNDIVVAKAPSMSVTTLAGQSGVNLVGVETGAVTSPRPGWTVAAYGRVNDNRSIVMIEEERDPSIKNATPRRFNGGAELYIVDDQGMTPLPATHMLPERRSDAHRYETAEGTLVLGYDKKSSINGGPVFTAKWFPADDQNAPYRLVYVPKRSREAGTSPLDELTL